MNKDISPEDPNRSITPDEENKAAGEGNFRFMVTCFTDVVKFAEMGVMAGAADIEEEEDRKLFLERGAQSIFVFKQLLEVFKKEIEKFGREMEAKVDKEIEELEAKKKAEHS